MIQLALNPVFHARTKHIVKECHLIRDEFIRKTIATKDVFTGTWIADIMTKALGQNQLEAFCLKLGVLDLHTPP